MKRLRPISLAFMTSILIMLACGPITSPEDLGPFGDAVDTAIALTRAAQGLGTEAPGPASDTPVPSPTPFCDRASFVSESIPAGMDFEPDTVFAKSWRLSNAGACTWTSGYSLVFDHGDTMSAPTVVPLGGTVSPGQEVDVIVDLIAPSGEGTYTGHWMLRNDSGVLFGLGSDASLTFSVEIDVVESPHVNPPMPPDEPINPPLPPDQPTSPGSLLPRTEQVHANTTISPNSAGHLVAYCPSGSVVVGGGFAGSSGIVVFQSGPRSNGWVTYFKNNTSSNKQLNAYAICLYNTAGSSSREINQVTVPAGGTARAYATCPAGSIVTGGGFSSSSSNSVVYATLKSGNGWETWVRSISGSDQEATAWANCLSGVSATTAQVSNLKTIPARTSAGGEVACPTDTLTTGGGYELATDILVYNSSMKPSGSSTWNAFARNYSFDTGWIKVYATCLSF